VRNKFGLALPVIRASSSSEPGGLFVDRAQQLRIASRQDLGEDSVEGNHTFGSSALTRRSARATAKVRAFNHVEGIDAIGPEWQNPKTRWVAQFALIQLAFPEKRRHALSGGTP
jgi:hypothetical protein